MMPDWRLFPPELLQLVSEKLPSIVDYVRFRAVCPAWRSASSPRHLPPQLPWLIIPRYPFTTDREPNLGPTLSLYDLSQSKTRTFNLPEIHGKHICGSSHGWLVLETHMEVSLFNPITRDQISLPSLSAQPNFFQGKNPINDDATNWRASFCIMKAILSSNPRLDPNCLVMVLFLGPWETAFCRIGDDCWTILSLRRQGVNEFRSPGRVLDVGYHNDLFYAISANGHAWIYDIHKPFSKHIRSTLGANDEHRIDYICSVEGSCNEHGLIIFSRNYTHGPQEDPIYMSSIYMLSDKQEIWLDVTEQLRSTCCFFFGGNSHCISLPLASLQLHGWEGNCMCYTSPQFEERIDYYADWYSCSIKLYKLNDRMVTTLASHLGFFRWPRYQNTLQYPYFLWLTPSLC